MSEVQNTNTRSLVRPPVVSVGALGWVKKNLFSNWFDSILTIFAIYLLYNLIPPIIEWAFIDAHWGDSWNKDDLDRGECEQFVDGNKIKEGACWSFIRFWFPEILYGRYPQDETWRINLGFGLLLVAAVPLFFPKYKWKKWNGLFLGFGFPVIAYILFVGDSFGLPYVETNLWGGLFLTLVLGIFGIVFSLPFGIILALGRRSKMGAVRGISIAFIEFWRGVPLITVLFMASAMFPLFMPEGVTVDKLIRCMAGIMFFSAAYMAEVVRGGLQAIPRGQYEAAQAMGLSYGKMMALIILPQALRIVIPGIVNTFIGLFKDTTLVLIIGLFDFLGMIQFVGTNPDWLGFHIEGYVFAAVVFWFFCFGMSRYSMNLEKKIGVDRK